jgi:hypothetical protein
MNRDLKLKVVSGGQTGVDLAGLWAAKVAGLETGGMAPRDWRTTTGAQPGLGYFFGLQESTSSYYGRTIQNVEESDLTIIIAQNMNSSGTKLTMKAIEKSEKLSYLINPRDHKHPTQLYPNVPIWDYVASDVSSWLIMQASKLNRPLIINIAGNSEISAPGIFIWAFLSLLAIFRAYFESLINAGFSWPKEHLDVVEGFQNVSYAVKLNNKFSLELV